MSRTRRWVLELLGAVGFLETIRPCGRAANNSNKNKLLKVLFFSKSSGFEHDVVKRTGEGQSLSETKLTELGILHGFNVVATKDGRVFDGDLSQYDAFFFFTTGNLTDAGTDNTPAMSARGKEALLAAIRNGKGFVGVHSASDTFHSKREPYETQQQLDPYIAMLGGEFLSHGSQQEGHVKVVDTSFPCLQGWAESFTIKEEWYSKTSRRTSTSCSFLIPMVCTIPTIGVHHTRSPGSAGKVVAESTSMRWDIVTTCG